MKSSKPTQLTHGDAAHLADDEFIFQVPKKYAQQILEAVPSLRHDFSDLGGRFISHEKQKD